MHLLSLGVWYLRKKYFSASSRHDNVQSAFTGRQGTAGIAADVQPEGKESFTSIELTPMIIEKVFKVVWLSFDPAKYFSASNDLLGPTVSVGYKTGEISRPKIVGSKLFAFKTLGHAVRWVYSMNCTNTERLRILECDAEISESQYSTIPALFKFGPWKYIVRKNEKRVRQFFQETEEKRVRTRQMWGSPPGTILCNWIRPIQEVDISSSPLVHNSMFFGGGKDNG